MDAGVDGGPVDAGRDSGTGEDAGPIDAGPVPGPTVALYPWNGFTTGSALVSRGAALAEHPLKPKLMWHPTDGAHHYQVQMESECPIEGFRDCTFPDPALDETTTETTFHPSEFLPVSMTPPVGRRYVWRVRACNAADECGAWSEPRYLDDGRQPTDYNGDGYADVAVGAPRQDNPADAEGNVFIYYGSIAGTPATPSLTLDSPANQDLAQFGNSIASAPDLNGDGFADLVIGAPEYNGTERDEGQVYVYYGSATGLSSAPDLLLSNPTPQLSASFGQSLSSGGDIDADGFSDLAIGVPFHSGSELFSGIVYIYGGGFGGIHTAPDLTLESPDLHERSLFGQSISTSGDLNGDGYADLCTGSGTQINPDGTPGRIFIYNGSPTGIQPIPSVEIASSTTTRSGFGEVIATRGDLNDDGYCDLASGAAGDSDVEIYAGAAFLYFGGEPGPSRTPDIVIRNPLGQARSQFGNALSTSHDLNGDGFEDLAIGASYQNLPRVDEGAVYVFYGASTLPDASPVELDNPRNQEGTRFGISTSIVGDINGDGFFDLAAGSFLQDEIRFDEGAVQIYEGSITGIDVLPSVVLTNPTNQGQASFGQTLGGI